MNLKRDFMENTNLEKPITEEEYNSIPVYYCPHCLSLLIKQLDSYVDYCGNCGCTDIETTDIFTWRDMYKKRFGKDF